MPFSLQENGLYAVDLFKNYSKRPVLKGVSIHVKAGEVIGLLGPNGAGKTTCFSLMVGLIHPTGGKIYFNNHEITHLPMYRRARLGIGYLPQEPSIFRGLSVEENILGVLELIENDYDKRQAQLDHLLDEFGINHLRQSPSVSLSGGERRRLEIARSLATNPQFLLLDEPFAGIDPIAVVEIRDLIIFLKNKGIGILITDHNVKETLA
ncbi:MAG: LPS export ABC transporter ATP-binding protein, partial [Proteobacteria bacterium]|nr:LPS export ABC transporter ATP-binding protein [Pseudomonadota bacterium]